ncbi:MAG: efflux RND transporter periplasmic adaptor subunit [Acidobacteriota bacterium]
MKRPSAMIGLALAAPLLLLACGGSSTRTAKVERGDLYDWVAAPGRVEGEGELVHLGPRVPGRLAEVLVHEGEAVHKGQILAVLENADARARLAGAEARLARLERGGRPQEVAAAEATVTAARARVAEAERAADRAVRLLAETVISDSEADAAARARDTARADLHAAEEQASLVRLSARDEVLREAAADVEAARDGVLATEIVAPMEGVIVKRHLLAGESIGLGATVVPVVTMTSGGRRWVRLEVPETKAGTIAVGQAVTVSADAYPGATFQGIVRTVAVAMGKKSVTVEDPRAIDDTEVLEVRAELNATADRLPYQMRVDAVIATAAEKDVLLIPWDAIADSPSGPIVTVRRGDRWQDAPVTLGPANDLQVSVRSGLSAGEEVRLREPQAPATGRPLTTPPRAYGSLDPAGRAEPAKP